MSLMIGAALYGILYLIPQFLSAVPDYNAFQSGTTVLISGVPTLLFMPFFPFLVRVLDVRLAIAIGLFFYALSCYLDSGLTTQAAGGEFYSSQVLRGLGQAFAMLFLNQAATSAVPREQAEDASGLFNAARNLGGSIGLAVIATMQERRTTFHMERVSETLRANSLRVQEQVAQGGTDPDSVQRMLGFLKQTLQAQATVMAFNDLFFLFAIGLVACIPFVLFLKPLPKGQSLAVH
jgi:DHA2 family multidrug resistance protein